MSLKTDNRTHELEDLLPVGREELLRRGLLTVLTERIWHLKERLRQLTEQHGSLSQLERRIKREGLSPDDHSLYHDWLEWRAAQHELDRLLEALKTAL
ncbi:MAG: hypothetical protein NZ610_03940 [Candidatus Bipolaricaulota bacterium]|nr:hypothetical protein [Candidatus Bipolaricaulota bacterium]MCS7274542.1 hypothetical protein [Candidatus Bipolaricaulota bacterium]MDW8111213.1 hypothetical protein [Candidatus Bipolaricaulota bacterium]MDW8329456.1 hypothetical protein [Candidatus Bipolaricaulota bacterium]